MRNETRKTEIDKLLTNYVDDDGKFVQDISDSSNIRFLFLADFFEIDIIELGNDSDLAEDEKKTFYGVAAKNENVIKKMIINKFKHNIKRGTGNQVLKNYEKPLRKLVEKKCFTFSNDVNLIMEYAREVYLKDSSGILFNHEKMKDFIYEVLLRGIEVIKFEKDEGEYDLEEYIKECRRIANEWIRIMYVCDYLRKENIRLFKYDIMNTVVKEKIAQAYEDKVLDEIGKEIVAELIEKGKPKIWEKIIDNWDVIKYIYSNDACKELFRTVIRMQEEHAEALKEEAFNIIENTGVRLFAKNVLIHKIIQSYKVEVSKRYRTQECKKFIETRNIDEAMICSELWPDILMINEIKQSHIELFFLLVCAVVNAPEKMNNDKSKVE